MDRIRDVTGPIEENIFVAFHDPNVGIIEVLGEPGGLDQTVGSCVGAHRIPKFKFKLRFIILSFSCVEDSCYLLAVAPL